MPSKTLILAVAAAGALGLAATPASAASCLGSCGTILGASGDVSGAPGGGSYTWISTNNGPNGAGEMPSVGGTNGTTLTTGTFTATAGQVLAYSFNFVTSDGQDPGNPQSGFVYQDYAFAELINTSTNAVTTIFTARTEPTGSIVPGVDLPPVDPGVVLSPASVPISAGSGVSGGPVWSPLGADSGSCYGPGCGLTGWIGSTYSVPTGGSYQLVFGVSNWQDTAYQTGMAIAGLNIAGTPIDDDVPEPASWAMMLLGLGLMGAVIRRRPATQPA